MSPSLYSSSLEDMMTDHRGTEPSLNLCTLILCARVLPACIAMISQESMTLETHIIGGGVGRLSSFHCPVTLSPLNLTCKSYRVGLGKEMPMGLLF